MNQQRNKFLAAADQADRAAAACGTEAELVETMKVLRYMEEIEIAMLNQRLTQVATSPARVLERLPVRESGDDIGRVEASIPKNLLFRFMKQRNFGEAGFTSDEGMRDFLKAYPQYAVKTVSGKLAVGYGSKGQRTKGRVKFAAGVLNLAT